MSFGSRSLPPPTPEDWARWARIRERGVCATSGRRCHVEIHHLLSGGGLRLGHRYTVGLAPDVHKRVKAREFKTGWPNQMLLDKQDDEIYWPRTAIPERPERKRKSKCTRSDKTLPRNWTRESAEGAN